jgi:hypothetical protein
VGVRRGVILKLQTAAVGSVINLVMNVVPGEEVGGV